ncbi:amino acid ABC transporter substrate-binding protein, PAAT family [Pseudomonas guineae]|uniref:Amino acid ABC transporter substrate-binding protein, PAAT family n=1 Tax=Pseudomonas guineae TaxID=425504 RepID=A0A1I3DDR0_9PSED|nr:hypothetical protein [Pseudomonas guineae]SFH84729.1 amino acid ABC transporter substrate-binding protein, PAAT family [Pseudomonas guineae]
MLRIPLLAGWRWLLGLLLLSLLPPLYADEGGVIHYPRRTDGDEFRSVYELALLQLALEKADSPLRLEPSYYSMEQERALVNLERNERLDVVWSVTSHEREQRLLPVRIPLDKGLYGWRIALLPSSREALLKNVRTLDDLRPFSAGQGHDWPDTDILRSNGLPVTISANYGSLFRMLQAQRFDYFPRSLIEIWGELEHPRSKQLVADTHVLLHYPAAMYFFFSRQRPELAETVRLGLERAIADGSFEHLFQQHFAADLQRAQLNQRQVIELENPLLPSATPLQRRELWLTPLSPAR